MKVFTLAKRAAYVLAHLIYAELDRLENAKTEQMIMNLYVEMSAIN